MVRDAQRFNQTDVVIMGIIVIGICGIVLDLVVQLLDRRAGAVARRVVRRAGRR